MEWLGPLSTLAAGGLIAWSIRKSLADGRTIKVKEFEVELGSKEREMKLLRQEVDKLKKSRDNS